MHAPVGHDDGWLRQIEIYAELRKSETDPKTGRIEVRGVASDNSLDFTREVVKISKIETQLSILNRGWGKFNLDHGKEIVGEITRIGFITPDEARAKYGQETVGTVLEVEGWIYPITDKTPPNSDVREVHKLVDAGARLGFSVQGGVGQRIPVTGKDGREYNVAVPSFLNQVAITGQPVNLNTICLPFAKSLAAVLCEGGLCAHDLDEAGTEGGQLAPLLYLGDSGEAFVKSEGAMGGGGGALGSSGTQAIANVATGGDATRVGAADFCKPGSRRDGKRRCCDRCDCTVQDGAKFCPGCGTMQDDLKKSLLLAAAQMFEQTHDLLNTHQTY